MKTLKTIRSAALATLTVAVVSLPTLAQAGHNSSYSNPSAECKSQENDAQLIGGILGAVVGGVVGSQVSANGARSEGSAIGAVLGGLAGAGIGDESVNCDKRRRTAYRNGNYSGQTYGRRAPVVYDRTVTTRRVVQPRVTRTSDYGYNNGYRNRRNDRGYTNGYNNAGYNNGYSNNGYSNGHSQRNNWSQLEDVRMRLRELRRKNRRIEQRLSYEYRPSLVRRQQRVCDEILRLEKKERRLSRRSHRRPSYGY